MTATITSTRTASCSRLVFARMRETRFTMSCWLCGGEHVWSKRWATFAEDVPEDGIVVPEVARERA